MFFDTHMHSSFSTDSKMSIKQAIEKGREFNIGICITDHMDLNFPEEGQFIFNCEEFFREYSEYRNNNVLLGIELGLRPDVIEENKKLISTYNFDYVIGSTHFVNGVDPASKCYYEQFSNKKNAYESYLEQIYRCVSDNDYFDSMGHIDYICRYSPYEDKEIYYRQFGDYIDEIIKVIINKRKVMELNTARLNNDKAINNLRDIYKRYKELGGDYVTVGSDAHKSEDIGRNFAEAVRILGESKLRPCYFKNRTIVK